MADQDPSSIRNIAASLILKSPDEERKPTREQAPAPGTEAELTQPGEQTDETELPVEDGEGESQASEDQAAPDVDEGETFTLRVDGETREVSLKELLASYSGEGAIAKRLQEATEARNEAQHARDVAVAQERDAAREVVQQETAALRAQTQALANIYQHYGEALLQPKLQPPDERLRQTDPLRYLTEEAAWRRESDNLAAQRQHMQDVVVAAEEQERRGRAEFARREMERMVSEVPAMRDLGYRKAQLSRVMDAAKSVGFSEEEIRGNSDRRLIYMAMLAAETIENLIKTRKGGKPIMTAKAKTPASVTVLSRRSNGQFKKQAGAMEQARKTGKVEDVAKTMFVRSKPGQRPRA